MATRSLPILLSLFAFALALSATSSTHGVVNAASFFAQPWMAPPMMIGGWGPIKNVTEPEVQDVAKFAVTENNKKTGTRYVYMRVVSGETQIVAGINYRLLIRAKTGRGRHTFEAVVWVKPWENSKELTSFKLIA